MRLRQPGEMWSACYVTMGNGAGALRAFADCRERLRDDLGASPSPSLERLHLAVLRGEPISGS